MLNVDECKRNSYCLKKDDRVWLLLGFGLSEGAGAGSSSISIFPNPPPSSMNDSSWVSISYESNKNETESILVGQSHLPGLSGLQF